MVDRCKKNKREVNTIGFNLINFVKLPKAFLPIMNVNRKESEAVKSMESHLHFKEIKLTFMWPTSNIYLTFGVIFPVP